MSSKAQIAWGIKGSFGLLPFSIRRTRKQAIDAECISYGEDWDTIKSYGLKCVKVSIQELNK